MEVLITNRDLFNQLKSRNKSLSDYKCLLDIVLQLKKVKCCDSEKIELQDCLRKFCSRLEEKWKNAHRIQKAFFKTHNLWLNNEFVWPEFMKNRHVTEMPATSSGGRKRKAFEELSNKQKLRRTENLRNKSVNELSFAMTTKLAEGSSDINKILKFLEKNPEKAENVRLFCENMNQYHCHTYSKEQALSLFISMGLSKQQYLTLRKSAREENCYLYPSYYQIQQAKEECYPPKSSIMVTDRFAKISLQSLLDHTAKRILKIQDCEPNAHLILFGKYGFDGASGQSMYKQRFADDSYDDSSIFMAAYVPLKLCYSDNQSKIVWENPKPSSTFYCRPLNFQFIKESKEVILDCSQALKDEKQLLNNTVLHNNILVRHKIYLTMIDGKICTCLAGEKSSMVCYICGAKPTEMNRPEIILEKDPKAENYQFGLSSLHSWIRSFECLLHISYNLSFQKWSARSAQDKESKENKKKLVQKRFKEELGLNVDIVKQGVGTSNDGNTARRFFANPEKSSEITGIDINLIKKFHTILQVLASGERVDPQKYDQYCRETAQLYISLYNWYFMPASVHKILFYGAEIIKHFLFPIGQLSEEASEARNKHFRFYRESRARKCNRKSTNEDVLHNLLLSSDPFISNLKSTPKSNVELTDEAKSLLL